MKAGDIIEMSDGSVVELSEDFLHRWTFLATDRDGEVYGYNLEPYIEEDEVWVSIDEDPLDEQYVGFISGNFDFESSLTPLCNSGFASLGIENSLHEIAIDTSKR